MPSKSAAQHWLMVMCSSKEGRKKAKALGIKCPGMKVAKEFVRADKGKKPKGRR